MVVERGWRGLERLEVVCGGGPLIHTYSVAYHGFLVRMLPAAALAGAPGVAAVVPERIRRLATTRSPRLFGLLSSPLSALLADFDFGANLVIAIIDTATSASRPPIVASTTRGLGPTLPPLPWGAMCSRRPTSAMSACLDRRGPLSRGLAGGSRGEPPQLLCGVVLVETGWGNELKPY